LQTIQAHVRKLETPIERLGILNLKTPRTQRLRFLAGQKVKLEIPGVGSDIAHVASCPCDDMHLQFHIVRDKTKPFAEYVFSQLKPNEVINIEGPSGHFVLHEDETSPIVFIAFGSSFAPINSLIEHAMTLDVTEHIDLYWAVNERSELYLHNRCRAWADAFERFSYTPVIKDAKDTALPQAVMQVLLKDHPQLASCHFYVAGPAEVVDATRQALLQHGLTPDNVFTEALA